MDTYAPRVLVVDDEDNISFLVGSALRLQGYRVECVASGAAAVAAAAVLDPQVVVLDIQLPDFDGYEVLRRLRGAAATALGRQSRSGAVPHRARVDR